MRRIVVPGITVVAVAGGLLGLPQASLAADRVPAFAVPAHECSVADATLDWGVKASFRDYISGSIAKGAVEPIGTVELDGDTYLWSGGEGELDSDTGVGSVAFDGGLHFTGHDGLLDLRIENPVVTIAADGTGTLSADVFSKALEGDDVSEKGLDLAEIDLSDSTSGATGTVWDAAPVQLSEAGAPGFGGFYEVGAELDPITLTLPTDCAEPQETAASSPAASEAASTAAAPPTNDSASTAAPIFLFGGIGLAVAGIAAAVTFLILSRRRKNTNS